jgi:hypothetical protein
MRNHSYAAKVLIISLSATCGLALAIYKNNTNIIARLAYKQQNDLLNRRILAYKQHEQRLFNSVFRHIALPQTSHEAEKILSSSKRLRPSDHFDNNKIKQQSGKVFQNDIDVASISLLTNGGINTLSTDPSIISQYQPLENTATLIDPLRPKEFRLTFLMDAISHHPSLSVVLPIRNDINKRIGYYGLKLKPEAIHRLIQGTRKIAELDPPERIYAVSYTSSQSITEIYKPDSELPYKSMKSSAITNGFNEISSGFTYLDHRKHPVVGAYAFVKSANMVVLVERDQNMLFLKEVQRLRQILLLGFLISFAVFAILIRRGQQRLVSMETSHE